ncbi:hypothetical protein NUU61_008872, partial [Penicillium alfredii]
LTVPHEIPPIQPSVPLIFFTFLFILSPIMNTPQVHVPSSDNPESTNAPPNENVQSTTEVEMGGTQDENQSQANQDSTLPDAQPEPEPLTSTKKNSGFKFLDFLASPIVEILVGQGEHETTLTAHQTLLLESPFLSEFVDKFEGSGPRRISLPDEHVEAFGCYLQFQYTRDYSVNQTENPSGSLEPEAADDSGDQLLRHARIYTLAEKLGLPALKSLAHTKIHRVNGTPRGELAYARYVYTHTPADDITIRKPVASYWASRSHVLRHEVDGDFKKLCLEVPEFAFDVLTLVLDRKEKSSQSEVDSSAKGSARKRLRSGV